MSSYFPSNLKCINLHFADLSETEDCTERNNQRNPAIYKVNNNT